MKKNILRLFVVLLAVMFLSTSVMAKSKKPDKKSSKSYAALKYKFKKLEKKLRYKIKKLEKKIRKLSMQKRGPRGKKGPPGPQGLKGDQGEPGLQVSSVQSFSGGDTTPIVCPGCWFPGGTLSEDMRGKMKGAYLPGVDMYGTVLSKTDLTGIDLRGATLINVDFSSAELIGANFSPRPYNTGGNPVESKTDLSKSDLSNADLTDADLTDVLGLKTVIWDNTTCPDGANSDNNGGTCENNL